MNVFLLGMMGSGKTSVGKKLANAMGYLFLDTDAEIEKKYGMKVRQIFENKGEAVFREYEKDILNVLKRGTNQVIATGGGLPCFNGLVDHINESGKSVYLKADASFLASRLKGGKSERPLIANMSDEELIQYLNDLLSKREVFYNKANIHIDAKSLKVADIIAHLNS